MVRAFGKKIRSSVEDAISRKIQYGIRKLDSKLQSLPKAVKVDKISALNVTFVDDVVVANSSIYLNVDGLFTARGHAVDFYHHARNSRPSMSCGGRPKMVGMSIHENVLNSASLVHFKVSPYASHDYSIGYLYCSRNLLIYFSVVRRVLCI